MTEITSARNELVEKNLGLVHSCVNRFKGRGAEYDDLVQAGCVGLIKAADNFDESKGFAFSTYAVPVILGEIKRLFREGGAIKVGRAIKDKSRNLLSEKEKITVKLGREPTVSELAEELNIDVTETAMLMNASMPAISLTGDDETSFSLEIPIESHENEVTDNLALRQILDSLDNKDRIMLELRYFKGLTQSKTAMILGMTQVQVSRREKAVLEIIRKKLTL